ncbi:hypothetical protein ElyMa_004568000 [Elysia marginata]|uniref:Uncharacterized protein n=1 Tax=Elysia marginata TaxID=1093978 RepID=A0AAV4HWM3_9GAST|nr:hypothetical protein ElyMa_004568000 [Elysia marginata]
MVGLWLCLILRGRDNLATGAEIWDSLPHNGRRAELGLHFITGLRNVKDLLFRAPSGPFFLVDAWLLYLNKSKDWEPMSR